MDNTYKYLPTLFFGLMTLFVGLKTSLLLRLGYLSYTKNNNYLWIVLAFGFVYYFTGLYTTLVSIFSTLIVEGILKRKVLGRFLAMTKSFYNILKNNVMVDEDSDSDEKKEVDYIQHLLRNMFELIDNIQANYKYVLTTFKNSVLFYYTVQVYLFIVNFVRSDVCKQCLKDTDNNIDLMFKELHKLLRSAPYVDNLVNNDVWDNMNVNKISTITNRELDEYETIDMEDLDNTDVKPDEIMNMDMNKIMESIIESDEMPDIGTMMKDMKEMKKKGLMPVFNPENMMSQLNQLSQMVTNIENLQKTINKTDKCD